MMPLDAFAWGNNHELLNVYGPLLLAWIDFNLSFDK